MPSISNRSLLLGLTVHTAENNIRRGVLVSNANARADEEGILERSANLAPGTSITINGITNNSCLVLTTNIPVQIAFNRGTDSITFTVNSLFVYTDNMSNLVITNPSLATKNANIRLIQV